MLKFWDKKPFLLADGSECSPELAIQKWPFAANVTAVMQVEGGLAIMFASLPILCQVYGVDSSLGDAEKLIAIQTAMDRANDPNYDAINEMLDGLEQEDDDE